ncbi:MAG: hypothetical protein ACSHYA_01940 [Opitutaceae bacterium]
MIEPNPTNDIQKIGDCYEASYNTAKDFSKVKQLIESASDEDTDELQQYKKLYEQYDLHSEITIVHGWVRSDPNKEDRTHHAWVEINELVLESQVGRADSYSKEQYDKIYGPIKDMTRYTDRRRGRTQNIKN